MYLIFHNSPDGKKWIYAGAFNTIELAYEYARLNLQARQVVVCQHDNVPISPAWFQIKEVK